MSRDHADRRWRQSGRTIAIACGLSALCACGEQELEVVRRTEERAVLAAEVQATAAGPMVEIRTASNFPLKVTGKFGTGCVAELKEDEKAARDGRLQVSFLDYKLELASAVDGNGQPRSSLISKECTISLTVTGAQGYRFAIQKVTFVGSAFLLGTKMWAQFNQNVWWSGRAPSALRPAKRIPGEWTDDWIDTQNYTFEAAPVSDCITTQKVSDEITISTKLTLYNTDSEPAFATVGHLISEATPGTSADEPAVLVQLQERRCN